MYHHSVCVSVCPCVLFCSLLGQWEDGLRNYQTACKLDYDETVDEWMREIKPKVRREVEGGEKEGGAERYGWEEERRKGQRDS